MSRKGSQRALVCADGAQVDLRPFAGVPHRHLLQALEVVPNQIAPSCG